MPSFINRLERYAESAKAKIRIIEHYKKDPTILDTLKEQRDSAMREIIRQEELELKSRQEKVQNLKSEMEV